MIDDLRLQLEKHNRGRNHNRKSEIVDRNGGVNELET
jgi:hypothetical protein